MIGAEAPTLAYVILQPCGGVGGGMKTRRQPCCSLARCAFPLCLGHEHFNKSRINCFFMLL